MEPARLNVENGGSKYHCYSDFSQSTSFPNGNDVLQALVRNRTGVSNLRNWRFASKPRGQLLLCFQHGGRDSNPETASFGGSYPYHWGFHRILFPLSVRFAPGQTLDEKKEAERSLVRPLLTFALWALS